MKAVNNHHALVALGINEGEWPNGIKFEESQDNRTVRGATRERDTTHAVPTFCSVVGDDGKPMPADASNHKGNNDRDKENSRPGEATERRIVVSDTFVPPVSSSNDSRTAFFVSGGANVADVVNPADNGEKDTCAGGKDDETSEYGSLTSSAPGTALVLEEVVLPLLQNGAAMGRDSTVTGSLQASHALKFASSVSRAHLQIGGGMRLPLPDVDIEDLGNIKHDNDVRLKLEVCVSRWLDLVSRTLEDEGAIRPDGNGPLAEVDYWRRRHAVLSTLESQTKTTVVQQVLKALRLSGKAVSRRVDELFNELARLAAEAAENSKFLSTLERHLRMLSKATIPAIVDDLPFLLDSLRMVWTVSRHYNRDERMFPLMERVALQLCSKVIDSVDIKTILSLQSDESLSITADAQTLLQTWRTSYMKVRARIEEEGTGQRRWEFDRRRLFDQTDYIAKICGDLHKLAVIIDQFRRFLSPDIATIIGESGNMNDLTAQVDALPKLVEIVKFDVFDQSNRQAWSLVMTEFEDKVREIDECAGASIETAFQTLRSAEAAYDLVQNFRNLESRPLIHRRIDERYTDILHQYAHELTHLEDMFQSRKNEPPMFKSYPPVAGAIAWSDDLYQRAKRPILRFKSSEVLTSGIGNEIKHKYLAFARNVDAYKRSLHNEWVGRVAGATSELWKVPVVKKVKVQDSNGSLCTDETFYASNFPDDLCAVICEAKYLDCLGFAIPEPALTSALQENTYQRYTLDLEAMLRKCNELLTSLTLLERNLLNARIREVERALLPGQTTINWTSQRIPAFVAAGSRAIEKFRSILTEVRKHAGTCADVVRTIERYSLVEEGYFCRCVKDPISIADFTKLVETKVDERIHSLVQQYQSITPLILKVEMAVIESDAGDAPIVSDYYQYWEKRVYNALVQMIIRSLATLVGMLRSSPGEAFCRVHVSLNGSNIISLVPSPDDICQTMYGSLRRICESAKAFVRWRRNSCVEATPQVISDGVNEDTFRYTFYRDVSVHPFIVSMLVRAHREVCGVIAHVSKHMKQWKEHGQKYNIWNQQNAGMDQLVEMDPSCQWLEAQMEHYEELHGTMNTRSTEVGKCVSAVGFLSVDFVGVARSISNQALKLKSDVGQILAITSRQRFDSAAQTMDNYREQITKNPESFEGLTSLLLAIEELEAASMDMELACIEIRDRYETLRRHNIHVNAEEADAAMALGTEFHSLVIDSKTKKHLRLADMKDQYREVTRKKMDEFLEEAKAEHQHLLSRGPGVVPLEEGVFLLNEWQEKVSEMQLKKTKLLKAQALFNLHASPHPDLAKMEAELTKLSAIYSLYRDFRAFEKAQASLPWDDLDVALLRESVQGFDTRVRTLNIGRNSSAFSHVERYILSFQESIPLILSLKNDSVKSRHWEKLATTTATHVNKSLDTMTAGSIFSMQLNRYPNEVNEVVNEATEESRIEVMLNDIKDYWRLVDLDLTKYSTCGKDKGFVLRAADELLLQLEDHLLNLQTVGASRFVAIFWEEVKKWERQLNVVSECLEAWYTVQQKWMYLESIFTGAEDICLQLPDTAKKFDVISKCFCDITKAVNDNPNAIHVCCTDQQRLNMLNDLSDRMDQCQKSLTDYLDMKRTAFARFYFISDDELLSVVGSSDPSRIQVHLLKLFDNVCQVGFAKGKTQVVSITSSEGESFDFANVVSVDGPVESWMTCVEDEMKKTLWAITKEAIFRYASEDRIDWITSNKTLGQNAVCGSQVWWTWQVEDCFQQKVAEGDKHALKDLEAKLTGQLVELVNLVRSPLDENVRKKVNTLLITDVHARDIVLSFVRESVLSIHQFEWDKQLRFYWDREDDDLAIKQCTAILRYGFEFLGLSSRLVITPLTDICYMTLTQALAFKLGGSLAGPAGTGKTETVKDLAKSIALPCFVINCGEGLDYKAIGAIFSGLIQSGSWGCFDEFNRINIEVLSVVSSQLKAIQNALMLGDVSVNMGTGSDMTVKRVKGFATSGIFITMNPGYAGRTELPDNLKALFRPVTMVVPDFACIAENMLFSEGFNNSKVLATKMVVLYSLAKEQLSKQSHYDFGLRSMKTVLATAGSLKRQFSKMPEDLVLMRILRDANMPKFVFDDVPLFTGLINDLFPGLQCDRIGYDNLSQEISSDLEQNMFKPSSEQVHIHQVDKVVQLFETQLVRHTTMIVGPTGGGKSLIMETLANARHRSDGVTIKSHVINPKAQSIDELYGILDPTTRDWTDGILSKIFREVNKPLPVGREIFHWIVFDGDVDARWVENLNSVMDDNRILTLPNGERIQLQPHCAIVCEVFDLQYASPATISRCGMVWVDPQNLGYKPYYERWLRQRYSNDFPASVPEHSREKDNLEELFDKFAVPCTDYLMKGIIDGEVGERPTLVVSVGDINLCKQLCSMLDGFLSPPGHGLDEDDVESIYVYCVLWSFGAYLDHNSRAKFDLFLRNICCVAALPGDALCNYFFSVEEHRWVHWETRVPAYKEPKPFAYNEVVVPTTTSVMYKHMLEQVASLKPLLFVGESGTAKTLTIEKYISSLPAEIFARLKINMSSRTTSRDVQLSIESNVDKRTGNVYGPVSGKKLVVFFDDLNLPKVDLYGTQQPIALLLTLLNHGFVYSRKKDLNQKILKDLQYIAAMAPPGGGRNSIDARFVSRFNVLNVPEPNRDVLSSIYSTIIETKMVDFSAAVRECSSKITTLTLQLFNFAVEKLPPTPSKFHYIFNLRDLSRVYEGLCCATPEKVQSEKDLVRLWRNEMHRVFVDRLSIDEDSSVLKGEMSRMIRLTFPESSDHSLKEPLVFGDFENAFARVTEKGNHDDPRLYYDMGDYTSARTIFNEVVKCYNRDCESSSKPLRLVLFEMALSHLVRLLRIIRNPRGNALLIGIGGSGKQSITRLAAYASGYELFEITLRRGYKEADFREDLKALYMKLVNGPVVFLVTDAHVVEEGFLEYINNMLCNSIQPALFEAEEKDAACNTMRNQAKVGGEAETMENLWKLFIERCHNNLHLVLAMSPSGELLRQRCRNFPGLVSGCMIDWFHAWPSDALEQVASTFLGNEEGFPTHLQPTIAGHIRWSHETVAKMAETFCEQMKRPYNVTSKTFLDFVQTFKEQLHSSSERLNTSIERLEGGLAKIVDAADDIDRMQVELREKKITVDAKTKEVEALIETIQEKTYDATSSNEEALAKQLTAVEQAKSILVEKNQADAALNEALPALEAAAEALNGIQREDLHELKAFNNPPIHVKIVCQMCTVLRPTGDKLDDSWEDAKKMLGNAKLLDLLKAYPKDSITEKMYRLCKKIMKENKKHDISVENMSTKSKAGKGLLVWVLAILKYYEAAKNVAPLREKVKTMEKAQAKTEAELSQLQTLIAKLNQEVDELNSAYKTATEELNGLQYQAAKMEKRLSVASKLIEGLTGERARWTNDIERLGDSRDRLVGDCLVVSAFLSYTGPLSADYRHDLIEVLLEDVDRREIPRTNDFKVEAVLTSEAIIQGWKSKGLPSDEHSIQNGVLTTMSSRRFPLCIDPQEQAVKWIKNTYAGQQLTVKSMNQGDFMKHLELAIQFGNPFLFENVSEEIDPKLDPVLEKNVITENGNTFILLGNKKVEWEKNFRLFFCTKLSNPSFSPETMGKVAIINYSVTSNGLADQLLNVVVNSERPDLEKRFKIMVEEMADNSKLLVQLEDSLLKELTSSSGNILDNENLINTLDETKLKATEIQKKLEQAQITKVDINKARNELTPVARRGSILYFASSSLSAIDSIYEISLGSFSTQFIKALKNAKQNDDLERRLDNLIQSCMMHIYEYTCMGIFERHKLTFAFHLACMILDEAGNLDRAAMNSFLKGDCNVVAPSESVPDGLCWMGESGWKMLLSLETKDEIFVNLKLKMMESPMVFKDWYDLEAPEETSLPCATELTPMQKLCMTRVLRPDRSYNAAKLFVRQLMGDKYVQPPVLDYKRIFQQSSPLTPTVFILSPGADPQAQLQKIGDDLGFTSPNKFRFVSLGQGQGPVAMQVLEAGYERGHWVLLQNCHLLQASWLKVLDKTLEQMKDPHDDFRLWLTTEPSTKFPLGILQKSMRVVTEPPDGLKLNMKSTMAKIDQEVLNECPHPAFPPLVFALTFLHAVVQERQKYANIGWNVSYDFNDSDYNISRRLMSLYLSKAWHDGSEELPWGSLKYLIGDAMYGGRVSDDMDQRVLTTYVDEYMGDFLFNDKVAFYFSREGFDYCLPERECCDLQGYMAHIEKYPLTNSPAVFGLHPNAEIGYFVKCSNEMWLDLISLQKQSVETSSDVTREDQITKITNDVLQKVPIVKLEIGSFNVADIRNRLVIQNDGGPPTPCQVVLLQELGQWNTLCKRMASSLMLLQKAMAGEIGMSDRLEEIGDALFNGFLPKSWTALAPATEKKLGSWMVHFTKRYEQYSSWVQKGEPTVMWLSGLHFPESYLTALVQTTCRRRGWPLDKSTTYSVVTKFSFAEDITQEDEIEDGSYINGLYLEGAGWNFTDGHLTRQDPKKLVVELPVLKVVPVESSKLKLQNTFKTPVYTTSARRNAAGQGLVFEADLASVDHPSIWTLQGVAIVLNTSN